MTKKNILLTIGSFSAAAIPVASVISCGVNEATKDDIGNKFRLESSSAMARIQEEFWWEVFKEEQQSPALTGNIADNAFDVSIVKEMVDYTLKKHLSSNEQYLINMMASHLQTKAMKDAVGTANIPGVKTTHALASKWKLLEYRTNGDITDLTDEPKKFILKNDKKFRTEVLRNSIAYLFLNKEITKTEYKEIFMKEDDKFTDIQKVIDGNDYNLVNEALKQHKFARWNVSLTEANSMKWLNPTEPTFADTAAADAAITGTGTLVGDMKYSEKSKKAPAGTLPVSSLEGILGFSGFAAKTGTRGLLKQDLIGLKTATNIDSWNGYVEEDIVRASIKYFKKDTSLVALERVFGYMPIFKNNILTFKDSYFKDADKRKMLAMELATSSSAYSQAEKYYYSRKTNPIQLDILSEDLRDVAIDHGFKFIKED